MTAKQSVRARRERHQAAAAWVLENRHGRRSAEDARVFREWLECDPENRRAYEAAERLMGDARTAILRDPELRDFEVAPRRPAAQALAVALLAVAFAGSAFLYTDGPMRLRADAMSGTRETPVFTLADGSTMQLDASSAASYRFTRKERTVTLLRGQAFFQVAKDASRPFVVEAGGGRTTALGTAFDVRLGEETTRVTVTEHAVDVAPQTLAGPSVRIDEGRRAVYGRDGNVRYVIFADPDVALAWRKGQIVVDDVALAEVVEEIGRRFSGRIVIASPTLAARRVSGTFAVADADAALALLQESFGFSVTRLGPFILLRD
jgi:transmembrane sensor